MPLIERTVDKEQPREWYYALMDYGVMLKKKFPNLNKRSAHYKKQAPFKGSNREIRGMVLKLLLNSSDKSEEIIVNELKKKPEQVKKVLQDLQKEGFIKKDGDIFTIV